MTGNLRLRNQDLNANLKEWNLFASNYVIYDKHTRKVCVE